MQASQCDRLRVVITMRDDFFHRANAYQDLSDLLQSGSFPLTTPRRDALRQMIERPAERAGIAFDAGLVEQILEDTGDEPGGLALMAYALDELYKLGHQQITFAHYRALGGVQGAIGTRAENTFQKLPGEAAEKMAALQRVFRQLVEVDERGTATRQRAPLANITDTELATAFIEARLLVTTEAHTHEPLLEVAHEALLRKEGWPRLAEWISESQEDLILLRQMRAAAEDWARRGRPEQSWRWEAERLTLVTAMLERQQTTLTDTEQQFIEPEQNRLLRELEQLSPGHHERRRDIGDRLAVIGDTRAGVGLRPDGLPDIDWLPVPTLPEPVTLKTDDIEIGPVTIQPFFMARYLVTFAQYQAFVEAHDGFADPRWWQDFPEEYRSQELVAQRTKIANAPRDSVSWYQSVAFARWLDHQYREHGLFNQFKPSSPALLPQGEGSQAGSEYQERVRESGLIERFKPSSPALLPQGEGSQAGSEYQERVREMATKAMVQIAQDLRKRQTSAEEILWECLRDRRLADLKFRRQHPVAQTNYVADFFCYERKLIVELDGGIHQFQQAADAQRQRELEALGLQVIRFTNDQITNHLYDVLTTILQVIESPFYLREKGLGDEGLNWQIRLPTEWEWQWAAQAGTEARAYPWGDWQEGLANTSEVGLSRTTAVGLYPQGLAECGASDLAGNLREWCQNDYGEHQVVDGYNNGNSKVLRGGSFGNVRYVAASSSRNLDNPLGRNHYSGLRLVLVRLS
jgi:very-short-patch-repair endonuclease/formylglycine-generating enzyme required for sulfatase activity